MDKNNGRKNAACCASWSAVWSDFCAVAPSPELREKLKAELATARGKAGGVLGAVMGLSRGPRQLGFDDGVIIPPDQYPLGTPMRSIRSAAAERAPLRGTLRVIVVLVQFSDHAFGSTAAYFNDLFFSTSVMPHGSVKEYYRDISGGLVDIAGEVVGPFTLPQTLAWYANGNFGIGRPSGTPRANIMAQDAATAANPSVNFGLYDNDGNGFVDAFIIVHAGSGGEQTGNSSDIWSHKWTLPSAMAVDGKQIFAYLTIPQDAKLGVCAHELGHLLFGFPDLYDTDDTSEGIGDWCLMAGGSWNGGGDIPSHPSAWCKANQGWVSVNNVTGSSTLSIPDVKTARSVYRLWKSGGGGNEYFLLENRQRVGFDAGLPGEGLLIWHIDEAQPGNTDENHYKVSLVQADNKRDMELAHNRGDAGDPYPGASANGNFSGGSAPNSNSYANQVTCISVTQISASGPTMTAKIAVTCKAVSKDLKDVRKEIKDSKELSKDLKDTRKDMKEMLKERKDAAKEGKELRKDGKEIVKEAVKDRKDVSEGKGGKDVFERPGGLGDLGNRGMSMPGDPGAGVEFYGENELLQQHLAMLEARLLTLEMGQAGGTAQPFIGAELRPDLVGQAQANPAVAELQLRMADGDRDAKVAFDNLP
ncbi:M6 family metalloprotease domain-containing protein [Candidatus Nitrotoga arctica]|uniref:M6 family metalloprotease domain-containing protein n=1 Tax=Candidatus Nitrotoga arctica TaxID=453162 RepID=A0ABN8AH16_9PROT|nr:M6 family metalloprotease domain-containing protein [Candidatus Nitrotoga arctica]CAG9932030.1 M6 family metalloprotease domain-containing protein [Candidatus Nitrotoga arctica]